MVSGRSRPHHHGYKSYWYEIQKGSKVTEAGGSSNEPPSPPPPLPVSQPLVDTNWALVVKGLLNSQSRSDSTWCVVLWGENYWSMIVYQRREKDGAKQKQKWGRGVDSKITTTYTPPCNLIVMLEILRGKFYDVNSPHVKLEEGQRWQLLWFPGGGGGEEQANVGKFY